MSAKLQKGLRLMFWCILFKPTLFLRVVLVSQQNRPGLHTYNLPHYQRLAAAGVFAATDQPTVTHPDHPDSVIYVRVHC